MTETDFNKGLRELEEAGGEFQVALHPADWADLVDLGGLAKHEEFKRVTWHIGGRTYVLHCDVSVDRGKIVIWR